jgi:hypothetical protein
MNNLQTYVTVNSNSSLTISMSAISHVIENKNKHSNDDDVNDNGTTWIHFQSGKSVHVREHFEDVNADLTAFYTS